MSRRGKRSKRVQEQKKYFFIKKQKAGRNYFLEEPIELDLRSAPGHGLEASVFPPNNSGKGFALLIDCNVSPCVFDYLSGKFRVLAVKSFNCRAADEEIFALSASENLIIVTHDSDFADYKRFDLHNSPGIVILPRPPGPKRYRHMTPALYYSLEHFSGNPQDVISNLRGKVVKYYLNGSMTVHVAKPPSGDGRPKRNKLLGGMDYFPVKTARLG